MLGWVCLLLGGVPGPGGVSAPRGVPGPGGGVPGQVLPPVDRHTPVNILPCPQLRLRAVNISRLWVSLDVTECSLDN